MDYVTVQQGGERSGYRIREGVNITCEKPMLKGIKSAHNPILDEIN